MYTKIKSSCNDMCADNGYAMSSFDSFPVAQNASSSSDKLPASGITEVCLNVSVCFFCELILVVIQYVC